MSELSQTDETEQLKVLVDGQLILDVLLNRPSVFLEDTITVLDQIISNQVKGYILQEDLEKIWHISEKLKGVEQAHLLFKELLKSFESCKIDKKTIHKARKISLTSFDSALLLACAAQANLDAIISANEKDVFEEFNIVNSISIFNPSEFLQNDSINSSLLAREFAIIKNNLEKKLGLIDRDLVNENLSIEGWNIEDFQVSSSKDNYAKATVILWNSDLNQQISESAFGNGPIDAVCRALDSALISCGLPAQIVKSRSTSEREILPSYTLHSAKLQNIEVGLDARISAIMMLKYGDHYYRGQYTHRDSIKAAFYAYVQAIDNLSRDERSKREQLLEPTVAILNDYKDGKRDFSQYQLREVNLSKENLSGINLSQTDLSDALLCKSILSGATLTEVNLSGADLSHADLSYAKLTGANLQKADLTGANLAGVDLTEVDLTGANLAGVDTEQIDQILKHQHQKGVNFGYECLMLENLSNKLNNISPNPNQISLEMFGKLVEQVELTYEFLSQQVCFKNERFSRTLVFQNRYLTVYVIGWKPGQIVGKHHHGFSLDAIRVVKGKLTHWKFPKIDKSEPDPSDLKAFEDFPNLQISPEPGEEFSCASQLILIDRWEPHQIGNISEEDSVSLHFRFGAPPDDGKWEDHPTVVACQQTERCQLS